MNALSLAASARRRLPSLQTGVTVAGAALLLLGSLMVLALLRAEYRSEVDAILGDAERTAQKLAFRTGEVVDRVNQSTLLVQYMLERQDKLPLQALRRGRVLALDVTRVVLVTDALGFVVDSTSDLVALNLADEDHFKAHKRQADLGVTIGPAMPSPLAGGWGIPVARRLNTPGGEFAGLIVASVDPAALSAANAKTEQADTAIGVIGMDGIYRSRLLGGVVTFGERVDVAALERRAREIQVSRRPVKSPIDGVERFVSAVRVTNYPLMAVVAVNADSALAGYRHARATILGWAAAAAGLLLGGVLLVRTKVLQLERSRQQTRRAEATLRATLEGSMDAVSIMRAQRAADGRLTDLLITDSNARAAALLGRSADEVIGQLLCTLTPTIRTEGYLDRFDHVIRTGKASNAEVQATEPHLAGRWLHHQVVPLEDGLALITRDVTDRKEAERALAGLAHLDPLTRLGNRRDFERRLGEAHARALRSGKNLALLFIDLDGFKAVNDTHGHAAGDGLLVSVGQRLQACVRQTDSVSRLGGDEFTVLLENAGTPEDIGELCGRIVESLSHPHLIGIHAVISTPSIGAAVLAPGDTLQSLQARADAAMYRAKQAGKAGYRFADDAASTSSYKVPAGTGLVR